MKTILYPLFAALALAGCAQKPIAQNPDAERLNALEARLAAVEKYAASLELQLAKAGASTDSRLTRVERLALLLKEDTDDLEKAKINQQVWLEALSRNSSNHTEVLRLISTRVYGTSAGSVSRR